MRLQNKPYQANFLDGNTEVVVEAGTVTIHANNKTIPQLNLRETKTLIKYLKDAKTILENE